jgi:hypothetical protein
VSRGKKRRTTIPDEAALERARDLMRRDFVASRPNEKWVADITYLRTWSGFVYLAFILDCYSRMIVGWQLATHLRTDLVLDALEMANGRRRTAPGLIAHTDRGSPYTSIRYTDRLDELGAAPSVGSRGDAYDKAMAEAWVATFKTELVDGRRFPSVEHVEHETLHWIGFYNEERPHEELGDLPPSEYEELNVNSETAEPWLPDKRASTKPRTLTRSTLTARAKVWSSVFAQVGTSSMLRMGGSGECGTGRFPSWKSSTNVGQTTCECRRDLDEKPSTHSCRCRSAAGGRRGRLAAGEWSHESDKSLSVHKDMQGRERSGENQRKIRLPSRWE